MEWSFLFFLNSALLGVGLAMDALSVSMATDLHCWHLWRVSGLDAHDGLGLRPYHRGDVLFL